MAPNPAEFAGLYSKEALSVTSTALARQSRGNVFHLNVPKESKVSLEPIIKKESIPDHGWTVLRSILTAIMVGLLCWAGYNIDQSGNRLDVINASIETIQRHQEQTLAEQKATHDAVLVMSATYATKEDLERQRQIFEEQLHKIDYRLQELERKKR